MKRSFFIALFIILALSVSSVIAQEYRFERANATNFNPNDPGTYQAGIAINNGGRVLGNYSILSFTYFGAYTYGPPMLLGNLNGAPLMRLRPHDMNDNGRSVGSPRI